MERVECGGVGRGGLDAVMVQRVDVIVGDVIRCELREVDCREGGSNRSLLSYNGFVCAQHSTAI